MVLLFWRGAEESSATGVFVGNLAENSAQTRKTSRARRTTIIAARLQFPLSAIAESRTLLIHNPSTLNTNGNVIS